MPTKAAQPKPQPERDFMDDRRDREKDWQNENRRRHEAEDREEARDKLQGQALRHNPKPNPRK